MKSQSQKLSAPEEILKRKLKKLLKKKHPSNPEYVDSLIRWYNKAAKRYDIAEETGVTLAKLREIRRRSRIYADINSIQNGNPEAGKLRERIRRNLREFGWSLESFGLTEASLKRLAEIAPYVDMVKDIESLQYETALPAGSISLNLDTLDALEDSVENGTVTWAELGTTKKKLMNRIKKHSKKTAKRLRKKK